MARSGSTAKLQPKEANKTQTKKCNERVAVGNAVFLLFMPHSLSERMQFFPSNNRHTRNKKFQPKTIWFYYFPPVSPTRSTGYHFASSYLNSAILDALVEASYVLPGFTCWLWTVSQITRDAIFFRNDSECNRMLFHAAPFSTRTIWISVAFLFVPTR